MNKIFQKSVSTLPWKNERIPKNLVQGGIATIGDLVQKHPWEIFSRDWRQRERNAIKNLGQRSLHEIVKVLGDQGLKLSMTQFEMEQYKRDQ